MFFPLIVLALGQAQETPHLLRSVVGTPTGHNGYEEYLAAGDEVAKPSVYEALKAAMDNSPGKPLWLASSRTLANRAGKVSALIAEGNQKAVFDPRKTFDFSTLVPEYVYFKYIAKCLPVLATAQFSEGRNVQASSSLLSGLEFSNNLSGTGVIITYLVASAMRAIILKGYSDNLERVPLASWKPVVKECDSALHSPAFKSTIDRELAYISRSISERLLSRTPFEGGIGVGEGDSDDMALQISKMPLAERASIAKAFDADLRRFDGQCQMVVSTPETNWHSSLAGLDLFSKSEQDPKVRALLEITLPIFSQLFTNTLKSNTQLRLLKLHALIQEHRWRTGSLPATLDELDDKTAIFDPLIAAPFKYAVSSEGYELYSSGSPDTGRIDLVYVRPKSFGNDSEGPVNP